MFRPATAANADVCRRVVKQEIDLPIFLHIVVQTELIWVRTRGDRRHIILAFVVNPIIDDVFGKHITT